MINIIGDIFNQSGYSSHVRQLANSLYKLNNQVHIDTMKPNDWVRNVNDAELKMVSSEYIEKGVDVMINIPPFWAYPLSHKPKKFIGYCVWEGKNTPKFWNKYILDNRVDAIVVPSTHTRNALFASADEKDYEKLIKKVHVVPHGVNTKIFCPGRQRTDKFVFVGNKGWAQGINDRGGVQFLLKAFCEEFKNETDVELILKINIAYCGPGWNLPNELSKIGITPDDTKNVRFVPQNVEYHRLAELYQQGHCFVSPSMGDAFNIPCLEAMACGLPVITTDFGGQTDFVNETNGWIVATTPVDVTWDMMYESNSWGTPDIGGLKKAMREAYTNRSMTAEKGSKALETAKKLTWEHSANMLKSLIDEMII